MEICQKILHLASSGVAFVARWAVVDAVRAAHRIGSWATAIVAALKHNCKHNQSGQLILNNNETMAI